MGKSKKIEEVKKDKDGDIVQVRFEDNVNFTSSEKAIEMIDNGWIIEGVHVVNNQNGVQEKERWLRTNGNSKSDDNLDNL